LFSPCDVRWAKKRLQVALCVRRNAHERSRASACAHTRRGCAYESAHERVGAALPHVMCLNARGCIPSSETGVHRAGSACRWPPVSVHACRSSSCSHRCGPAAPGLRECPCRPGAGAWQRCDAAYEPTRAWRCRRRQRLASVHAGAALRTSDPPLDAGARSRSQVARASATCVCSAASMFASHGSRSPSPRNTKTEVRSTPGCGGHSNLALVASRPRLPGAGQLRR
jgi:hypothetical protein